MGTGRFGEMNIEHSTYNVEVSNEGLRGKNLESDNL